MPDINHATTTHRHSIELIAGDLKENSLKLVNTEEFRHLFAQNIKEKLSAIGKTLSSSGFDNDVLTSIQAQASEAFKTIYARRLTAAKDLLTQNTNSAEVIETAQDELAEALKKNNAVLLEKLASELSAKGQTIDVKDKTQLDTVFEQHKEQLNQKLKDTLAFFAVFGKEFKEKLSDAGKAAFATGLNTETLSTIQEQAIKSLQQDYAEVVAAAKAELVFSNDPEMTVKHAQAQLKEKLKKTKSELLLRLTTELNAKGQAFAAEQDQQQLASHFTQYLDKASEKFLDSLNEFKSLDSIKIKLQEHHSAKSSTKTKSTFSAQGMNDTKSLANPLAPAPLVGRFSVSNADLYQRLRYSIATKKPGEKITIDLSIPNREENQRQLAEAGLQHRTPGLALLISLLLFLFVHLRLYLKDDESKIREAINKLIKEDGLSIDPKDIKLKISQIAPNGKDQLIHEGPLSEISMQQLQQTKSEMHKIFQEAAEAHKKKLTPSLAPDSGYTSEEEEDDDTVHSRSSHSRGL